MSAHTPGPWHYGDGLVFDDDGFQVADAECGHEHMDDTDNVRKVTQAEEFANARLIAAAPDMWRLLRDVVGVVASNDSHREAALRQIADDARGVLAKARGGK